MTQLWSKNTTPPVAPHHRGLILACIAAVAVVAAGLGITIGLTGGAGEATVSGHVQVAVPTSGPGFSHKDEFGAFLAFSQKLEKYCGAMPGSETPYTKIPPYSKGDTANYWVHYFAPTAQSYKVAQIAVNGALSPRRIGEVYWNEGDPKHQLTILTCNYGS